MANADDWQWRVYIQHQATGSEALVSTHFKWTQVL